MAAYYFIIAYLACLYLQPGIKFPSLAVYRPLIVLGLLAIVAGILYLVRRRNRPPIFQGQIKMIFIILVFMGFSVLGAYIHRKAYNDWVSFAKMLLITFFMVNVVDSLPKFKKLFYSFLVIHVFVTLEGLEGFYTNSAREARQGLAGTLSNFLGDTNDFALAINMVLPYAYFMIFATRKHWTRFLLIGCFVLFGLSIMFTFSRGGFVTLLAVLLYILMKSKKRLQAMIVGGALALVSLMVVPQTYWERMQTIAHYEKDTNAQSRFWAWKAGWQMALDNPILGMGPGNFNTGYGKFYRPPEANSPEWFTAHSVYFQIMGELGFVGAFLIGFLILSSWRTQSALLKETQTEGSNGPDHQFIRAGCYALQASLLAFLVGGAFLSAAYYPHLWLNAALTQILAITSRETWRTQAGGVQSNRDVPAFLRK